ncbi:hypothetical protein AMELA_G00272750 [Ameiurus melas]|uniref:SEA domain-containing protein n=1 Tax=Ameiurus melas TaxID=219545 RepID=A0A7J5ZLQ8_AMEME|nr:hypothetical protein AMELA_G00272750 [Ameiurus melas]
MGPSDTSADTSEMPSSSPYGSTPVTDVPNESTTMTTTQISTTAATADITTEFSTSTGTTTVATLETSTSASTLLNTKTLTHVTTEPSSSTPLRSTTGITSKPLTVVTSQSKPTTPSKLTTVESTTGAVDVRYISFTTDETFNSTLSDPSSPAFNERANLVKTKLEPIFKKQFSSFINLTVLRFRSGSIITDMNLFYTIIGGIPTDVAIITTLQTANTGFNMTNISVTNFISTTTTPTTPTTTAKVPTTISRTTLSDSNSNEFKNLAAKVSVMLDKIYKALYGPRFIRTVVIAFKPLTKRAADNTQADVQLVFSENSITPIPAGDEIVQALKNAAESNSLIDATAITVVNEPFNIPVQFRTNGTFVAALSNTSSNLFANRSGIVQQGLNPFFTEDFPKTFSILTMSNFSNGGLRTTETILNFMNVAFARSGGFPNINQIGQTMLRAARNNSLPFKIFTDSITVNGTLISASDISSKISVFMACFMVTVSLLFTSSS